MALWLLAFVPAPGVAQVIVRDSVSSVRRAPAPVFIGWLDVGGAGMQQPDTRSMGVATIGGGLARVGARTTAILDIVSAHSSRAGSAQQLNGLLSLSPTASRTTETELGAFSTLLNRSTVGARNRGALLRQRFSGMVAGVPMGGSVVAGRGNTKRSGLLAYGSFPDTATFFGTEFGASGWISPGPVTIGVHWSRLRTNDFPLVEAGGFGLSRFASAYDIDEVAVQLSSHVRRATVQASVSQRKGRAATVGSAGGLAVGVIAPVTSASELSLAAGRQLPDPLRGAPPTNYLSATMRVAFDLGRKASSTTVREATVETFPNGGGILHVRIEARASDVVELTSSHDDWRAMRLVREGEVFTARLVLPSGTHRVAVRVNGGSWRAPVGLARVTDDLGGEAGVVVVP